MIQNSAVGSHVHRRALLRHADKATVTAESIEIETKGAPEFHDITDDIQSIVKDSGVTYGQVTVFSSHTTAAIRTLSACRHRAKRCGRCRAIATARSTG